MTRWVLSYIQVLVAAVQLGVRLLQQRGPELADLVRVREVELPPGGGQAVVHHNIHPLPVLPEPARRSL